jgi:hypothetical protein
MYTHQRQQQHQLTSNNSGPGLSGENGEAGAKAGELAGVGKRRIICVQYCRNHGHDHILKITSIRYLYSRKSILVYG